MDVPPPQYAQYPRGSAAYGSSDKLQALADGYFGLNKVFLINIALALGVNAAARGIEDARTATLAAGVGILALLIAIAALTYPHLKKIGYGVGWGQATPLLVAILMGLNSALCCGIIGYIVVQQIAGSEIKRYGVKTGFFGLKKPEVEAAVAALRAQESSGTYHQPIA